MSGSNSSQSGLGLSDLSDIGMSTLGGINPIIGNIYAGVKNAQATKQKQQAIGDYEANVESHYNKIFNQNFLDTNLATSVLTRAYDEMKNANNLVDKQAATTGATNESVLAAKTKNTEQANKMVSNIAAMGTARQDQAEGRYLSQQPNIMNMKTGMYDDKISAAQTQAANSNETMKSLLSLASGVPLNAVSGSSTPSFVAPNTQGISIASNQVITDDMDGVLASNQGIQLPVSNPYMNYIP